MTAIELPHTHAIRAVTLDLYRDIHKGIRNELFAITLDAGRLDPSRGYDRAEVARHVGDVMDLLVSHAEHEDHAIQPALEEHLPDLAERVAVEHLTLEGRIEGLRELARDTAVLDAPDPAYRMHRLHLELADFTGAYLAHQDVEERVIMPALEDAVGVEAVGAIHQAILAGIPPEEMAKSLAVMLPAMNIDGRAELLGGMRAGAPAEVFAGVWSLTGSVLEAADLADLSTRLDLG